MSEGSRQITIRRDSGLYAIFRKLIVSIDGTEILRIKAGETHTITLPDNAAQLHLAMNRVMSEPVDLGDVNSGDTLAIHIIKRSFQQMRSMKTIPFAIRIERG